MPLHRTAAGRPNVLLPPLWSPLLRDGYSQPSRSESNIAKCVVCLQTMDDGASSKVAIYKLLQRPDKGLNC